MTTISEEWARTAPAGPELDRVCAEWLGWYWRHGAWFNDTASEARMLLSESDLPCGSPSTDWTAAGPLLEAMDPIVDPTHGDNGICVVVPGQNGYGQRAKVYASTYTLAIARACAVLVARGISREDLG